MGISEEEYKNKLKKIESDFDKAKKELYYEYGMSHVKYKKGDIIKDHQMY